MTVNNRITAFIGDAVWFTAIVLLLMTDFVFPKLSNIATFVLPLAAVINASYNIYLGYYKWNDVTLITLQYGHITIRGIHQICNAQNYMVLWYINISCIS